MNRWNVTGVQSNPGSLETNHGLDPAREELGEFADGEVGAGADVDPVGRVIEGKEVEAGAGEVVGVEEFAARCAGAPDGDAAIAIFLGFMETTNQGGDDV